MNTIVNKGGQIILIPTGSTPEKIETSIAAFNQPLANLLEHIGLPTENILSPIEERRKGYRSGVDEGAIVFYVKFVEAFSLPEIRDFLHLFSDPEFVTDFNYTKPDSRLRGLAKFFKSKTKDVHINRVLDLIEVFPKGSLQNLASGNRYKDAMKFIN